MRTDADPSSPSEQSRFVEVIRGAKRRLGSGAWLARGSAVGLCILSIAFVGLLAAPMALYGEVGLFVNSLPKRVALALPPAVAVFAVGTAAGAVASWRWRYWSLPARLHQTLLAVLGIGFVWQLHALGFL